jgi:membrane-bound serine protease (ClpP class)
MPEWFLVLILIVLGLVFLLIEITIIPGFGLIGILGIFCLGIASWIAAKFSPALGIAVSVASLAAVVLFIRFFFKTGLWKQMRLQTQEEKNQGFNITDTDKEKFVGKEGVALSALRPAGIAIIEGKRLDVVSEGTFVPKGATIRVARIESNKVVVRLKESV